MISLDYSSYLPVPFKLFGRDLDGWDCWGLIHYIYQEEFGIQLPCFLGATERDLTLVQREKVRWEEVTQAKEKDIYYFQIGKNLHTGLCIENGVMLHSIKGIGTCVEKVDSLIWCRRLRAIYRHCHIYKSVWV